MLSSNGIRTSGGSTSASRRALSQLGDVQLSLRDVLGDAYVDAVVGARAALTGENVQDLHAIADSKVSWFPPDFAQRADELLDLVGTHVCEPLAEDVPGAGTNAFKQASKAHMAPLGGYGCVRVGQDGRAYLISKSEHYHASLGHDFPGFALSDLARKLGINNATHNNTRGYITRLLERRLVAACNGLDHDNRHEVDRVLDSEEPHVLNRVINLETGSLAVEAGLKMMLSRFYRVEPQQPEPAYGGRIPVFLVMGDFSGGITANYHGTTILTQVLRGLWPEVAGALDRHGLFEVHPVQINDIDLFASAVATCESATHKVAGFFHEIVLMNYGGKLLDRDFLQNAYAICREHDIPVLADEIQSCIWSPEYFLFREYDLQPDFVSIGKGFPAGNAPASRIVTTAPMDSLSQFGALVTNGQEEIASLYYLISMEFVRANAKAVRDIGEYYEQRLLELAARYPDVVAGIEGMRHLCGISFHEHEMAREFVAQLNTAGIDISAQTYKAESLPVALTKLPLIASARVVDFMLERITEALESLSH